MVRLSPAVTRFAKYSLVGVATLSFDLLLLAALTQLFHVPYYFSTPSAFLVAVSLNYLISQSFVFRGSGRPPHQSYAYFILIAGVGAAGITAGVYLLITYAHMHYIVARIGIAGIVGMCNYLTNLHLNFRVAGRHE